MTAPRRKRSTAASPSPRPPGSRCEAKTKAGTRCRGTALPGSKWCAFHSPEKAKGIMKKRDTLLKILGKGDLNKALTVHAHRFSASARENIEKAGGTVVEIK